MSKVKPSPTIAVKMTIDDAAILTVILSGVGKERAGLRPFIERIFKAMKTATEELKHGDVR